MSGADEREPRAAGLPEGPHSAVERLADVRNHQWSLGWELTHNWRGWLGSLAFHSAVLLILMTITWSILTEQQEFVITPVDLLESPEFEAEPLDTLFPPLVESDKMDIPDVPADVVRDVPGYNEAEPGVPNYLTSGSHLIGPWGRGGGGGEDLSGWPGYIGGLREKGLDVMFVFDSTGSMGGIILEVKTRIRQLMKFVTFFVPDARLGLVTYRDKKEFDIDDYQYTVKMSPLRKISEIDKLQRFLTGTEAYGGGDIPEAVFEGVKAAITDAGWNPMARKIIIVFGDAPPRPENDGVSRLCDLIRTWHARTQGVVSCIDTSGNSKLMEEFRQMAADGGGESTFINDERAIMQQLAIFIFGSRWKGKLKEYDNSGLGGAKDDIVIE